jgi:selenocysteine lyase
MEVGNICALSLCSDVSIVPVSKRGCVVPRDVLSHVRRTTCLITVMLANNETGVIMPVEEIGR